MNEKPVPVDRALRLAFMTAAHAHAMLCGPAAPKDGFNLGWPTFGAAGGDDNLQLAAEHLAPFVRENREAPPEALYIHGRGNVHDNRAPWAVLPLHEAFAYALFVMVLNQTDTRLAVDQAEREAREREPAKPEPIGDHVLGTIAEESDIYLNVGQPPRRNAKLPPPSPTEQRTSSETWNKGAQPFTDPRLDPKWKPPGKGR